MSLIFEAFFASLVRLAKRSDSLAVFLTEC